MVGKVNFASVVLADSLVAPPLPIAHDSMRPWGVQVSLIKLTSD